MSKENKSSSKQTFKTTKNFKYLLIFVLMAFGGIFITMLRQTYDESPYQDYNYGAELIDNDYMSLNKDKGNIKYHNLPATSSKNLAMPNLDGKEYLCDGDYELINQEGRKFYYNVYNGVYYTPNVIIDVSPTRYVPIYFDTIIGQEYTISIYNLTYGEMVWFGYPQLRSTSGNDIIHTFDLMSNNFLSTFTFIADETSYYIRLNVSVSSSELRGFKAQVQVEKGDIVTDYEIPRLQNDIEVLNIITDEDKTLTFSNIYALGDNQKLQFIINDIAYDVNGSQFNYLVKKDTPTNIKIRYFSKKGLDLINYNLYLTEGNNINQFGYNNNLNMFDNNSLQSFDLTDTSRMTNLGLQIFKENLPGETINVMNSVLSIPIFFIEKTQTMIRSINNFFTVEHESVYRDPDTGLYYPRSKFQQWVDKLIGWIPGL